MKTSGTLLAVLVIVTFADNYVLGQIPKCHLFNGDYKLAMRSMSYINSGSSGYGDKNGQWTLNSVNKPDFVVPVTDSADYFWYSKYALNGYQYFYTRETVGVTPKTKFSTKLFMTKPYLNISIYFYKINDDLQNNYWNWNNKIVSFTPDKRQNFSNWETFSGDCTTTDGRYCCGTNSSETCNGQFILRFDPTVTIEHWEHVAIENFQVNGGDCADEEHITTNATVLIVQPKNASVVRGQQHRLICQVDIGIYPCFMTTDNADKTSFPPMCQPSSAKEWIIQQCSWMKDGQWISLMGDRYSYSYPYSGVEGDCSLKIKSVDSNLDAGLWQCVITSTRNSSSTIASEPAFLTVVPAPWDEDYVESTTEAKSTFVTGKTRTTTTPKTTTTSTPAPPPSTTRQLSDNNPASIKAETITFASAPPATGPLSDNNPTGNGNSNNKTESVFDKLFKVIDIAQQLDNSVAFGLSDTDQGPSSYSILSWPRILTNLVASLFITQQPTPEPQ